MDTGRRPCGDGAESVETWPQAQEARIAGTTRSWKKPEEIIVENFPKIGKEIITQVQETQTVPNRIKPRRNPPRHILITLTKIKHKEQI